MAGYFRVHTYVLVFSALGQNMLYGEFLFADFAYRWHDLSMPRVSLMYPMILINELPFPIKFGMFRLNIALNFKGLVFFFQLLFYHYIDMVFNILICCHVDGWYSVFFRSFVCLLISF